MKDPFNHNMTFETILKQITGYHWYNTADMFFSRFWLTLLIGVDKVFASSMSLAINFSFPMIGIASTLSNIDNIGVTSCLALPSLSDSWIFTTLDFCSTAFSPCDITWVAICRKIVDVIEAEDGLLFVSKSARVHSVAGRHRKLLVGFAEDRHSRYVLGAWNLDRTCLNWAISSYSYSCL